MKSLSRGAYAVIAVASLLAVIALTYFWATINSGACAALAIVVAIIFVIAVNKSSK